MTIGPQSDMPHRRLPSRSSDGLDVFEERLCPLLINLRDRRLRMACDEVDEDRDPPKALEVPRVHGSKVTP